MKYIDEVTHQQVLRMLGELGEVEEKHFESVRGTIDYAKCMDTCGDNICRLPETKDWCSEDCPQGSEQELIEEPIIGGPCSYNTFKGECKIISILNENVIRYRFIPTEPLNLESIEWAKKVINREYYEEYAGYFGLKCLNKYPITKEDLEKCNIKENAVLDCGLEIITSGTCTPINFRFY